jgi:hypothetical protein
MFLEPIEGSTKLSIALEAVEEAVETLVCASSPYLSALIPGVEEGEGIQTELKLR